MIRHIVLAGDSIFDNDSYVGGEPGVIEQLRTSAPAQISATKVAVDGDCIRHVSEQISDLPSNTTDLVISVGGNDARSHAGLAQKAQSVSDIADLLVGPLAGYQAEYKHMLADALSKGVTVKVCTIYTQIPFEDPVMRAFAPYAIGKFNAVILDEASLAGVEALRLDQVCVDPLDFSSASPIEPSCQGGQKIVDLILSSVLASSRWAI